MSQHKHKGSGSSGRNSLCREKYSRALRQSEAYVTPIQLQFCVGVEEGKEGVGQDLGSRPNTVQLSLGFAKYGQTMTVYRGKTTLKNRLKPLLRLYDILNYLRCVGAWGIPRPFHRALESRVLGCLLCRHKTKDSYCHRDFTFQGISAKDSFKIRFAEHHSGLHKG